MKKFYCLLLIYPLISPCMEFSENELLISLVKNQNPIKVLKKIGARSYDSLELIEKEDKNFFDRPLVVEFDRSIDIETRLKKLQKNPLIETAQLNIKYHIQSEFFPNDPFLKNQWEHGNKSIRRVWDETSDCSKKIIAILDTGVNFIHPDLKDVFSGIGQNFIDPLEKPMDFNGHGTLIASIIGARGNNDSGVSGICWKSKIMPIKVFNELGEGYSSEIIKGIFFAKKNNASILNLSFGSSFGGDNFLKVALNSVISKGILVITPAGNEGINTDLKPFWPCSFKLKGMLCIASSNLKGEISDFSNFGKNSIDLAAPGENIFGIAPGSFNIHKDDLNNGWTFSEKSGISEGKDCLGEKSISIPIDYCQETLESSGWFKKDFGPITSKFDFSYLQFSFKSKGKISVIINKESIKNLELEQSDFFLDLNECQGRNVCELEFKTIDGNSKLALWDLRFWGLKIKDSSYQKKYGSSLSVAYVSGLAALIGTLNPKFNAFEIIRSLKEGSKFSTNLFNKIKEGRIVDPISNLKFLSRPKWN